MGGSGADKASATLLDTTGGDKGSGGGNTVGTASTKAVGAGGSADAMCWWSVNRGDSERISPWPLAARVTVATGTMAAEATTAG